MDVSQNQGLWCLRLGLWLVFHSAYLKEANACREGGANCIVWMTSPQRSVVNCWSLLWSLVGVEWAPSIPHFCLCPSLFSFLLMLIKIWSVLSQTPEVAFPHMMLSDLFRSSPKQGWRMGSHKQHLIWNLMLQMLHLCQQLNQKMYWSLTAFCVYLFSLMVDYEFNEYWWLLLLPCMRKLETQSSLLRL